jgi:hypothetical protein
MDEAPTSTLSADGSVLAGTITSELVSEPSTKRSYVRTRVYTITPTLEGTQHNVPPFKIRRRGLKIEPLCLDGTSAEGSGHYAAMVDFTTTLSDAQLFLDNSRAIEALSLYWHPANGYYIEPQEPQQYEQPEQPVQHAELVQEAEQAEQLTDEQATLVDKIVVKYQEISGSTMKELKSLIVGIDHEREDNAMTSCSELRRGPGVEEGMTIVHSMAMAVASILICDECMTALMYRTVFDRLKPFGDRQSTDLGEC